MKRPHPEDAALPEDTTTTSTTTTATKPDKRRPKKKKMKRPCFAWAKIGVCEFGESCKFAHDMKTKGKGVDPTSYGAPWPETRNPFGDVVGRNYSELVFTPERTPSDSSSSSSSSSTTSTTTPTTTPTTSTTALCLDQYVHYHPNHLCIIGLAANHAALQSDSTIKQVTYRDSGPSGISMLDMKLSGKKKAGAMKVRTTTILCDILMEDGTSYETAACIEGSLIEVNPRIVKNPSLLTTDPKYAGFIAIIQQPKDQRLKRDLAACRSSVVGKKIQWVK